MRALFSCTAGYGHFLPLLPLARAFRNGGHAVAFATAEELRAQVEAGGFELLPAGRGTVEIEPELVRFREQIAALPIPDRRPFVFTRRFAELDAPFKVEPLLASARSWRPDLVVHESADLAAPIVAAALSLPTVHQSWGRIVTIACWEKAAESVTPLWRRAGLEPEPLCGAFRDVFVDICPPSLQTSALPPVRLVELMRPTPPPPNGEAPPAWLSQLPPRSTVYVTLGTVHNDAARFRLMLDALAGEDYNVVLTIGRQNDPRALAPLPANAVVEQYVPQEFLLSQCDAVVAHAGSGSTIGALAHGLPMLLLPAGADQFENAARCEELGVARMLLPDAVTPDAVRNGVRALLADDGYRRRARALADEIEAMPAPADVAAKLVELSRRA